ncbi:MAG: hypothetical protein RQ801_15475, partial [Spirochaetaceae bacterium]|nr:hypothetical protein [Spirochaetaceae bacterium]
MDMKHPGKTVLLLTLLSLLGPSVFADGLFRNIASARFEYYSDERYGLLWEEVFITPLPKTLFLVTAVGGENTSFSDVTYSRLGLAFDLPGFYYGEASYALEGDWDTQDLLHSVFVSGTYESGPAMAGLSLTGEFSDGVNGAVASPSLKYYVVPDFNINTKLFIAFHNYNPGGNFFNFAVLTTAEYALDPKILFSIGGTYGTEYNPDFEYGKWS